MRLFRLSFGLRALYLSAFLLLVGNATQNIYIPTKAIELDFGMFAVSLLGSLYFFGFVIGCLLVPQYLLRVGHIRTFSAFAAVAGASAIVMSLTSTPWVWFILRFFTGFSLAALYLSIESWISAFSTDDNRGKVISLYRLTDLGGAVIGQMILFGTKNFDDTLSVVALFMLLSLIPITLTQIQMPILVETVPEKLLEVFKKTYKIAPLSFWGALMSGMVAGIFWSLIPAFVVGVGLDSRFVPLIVSSYLIGGALSQWPVGVWSDRVDRRLVILCVSGLAFLVSLMITAGAHLGRLDLTSLLLLVALFGAGGVPIYALSVAHANDWVKKTSVVDLSVLLLLSSSAGSVVGPLLFGGILSRVGIQNFFLVISFTHGFLILDSIYRIFRFSAISSDKKQDYVDLPETTPMIATVAEGSSPPENE